MNKAHRNVVWGVCITAFFVAMGMAAYYAPNVDDVTITGFVNAAEWDDNDNIVAVSISVTIKEMDEEEEMAEETFEEYYVADNEKAKELIEHIGKSVTATGTVTEDEDGLKTITIKSYKIVEEEK